MRANEIPDAITKYFRRMRNLYGRLVGGSKKRSDVISLEQPRPAVRSSSRGRRRGILEKVMVRLFPVTERMRELRNVKVGPTRYTHILIHHRPKRYEGGTTVVINEEWNQENPTLSWDSAVFPNLDVRVVPGDHSTRLMNDTRDLANCIKECLL